MKRADLSREMKAELWRLFDAERSIAEVSAKHSTIPAEAVEKQHRLWTEYRVRNPLK
jgi:hypothetical protein